MSDTKTETGRCTYSWGDIDAEGTAFYLCNYPTITNDQGELIHWGRECLHPDCKIKHRFHRQEFGHPAEASGWPYKEGVDSGHDLGTTHRPRRVAIHYVR